MKKLIITLITIVTLCTMLPSCDTSDKEPGEATETNARATEPVITETDRSEPEARGGIESMHKNAEYALGFYGVPSCFSDIIGKDDFDAWLKLTGFNEGILDPEKFNIIEFIQYFSISKEDFKTANMKYQNPVYTDEQIEALYSGDKNFLAQMHMNPNAIKVNGEIYTPRWIADHSLEEIRAAGIDREALQEKYDDWVEMWGEEDDVCSNTRPKLDAYGKATVEATEAQTTVGG